jgi:hypothetical protein
MWVVCIVRDLALRTETVELHDVVDNISFSLFDGVEFN